MEQVEKKHCETFSKKKATFVDSRKGHGDWSEKMVNYEMKMNYPKELLEKQRTEIETTRSEFTITYDQSVETEDVELAIE